MIDRSHDLSVTKQAKVLGISRGSVYYRPRPVSADDLAIMRRMDELHLEFPFAGSRMLRDLLQAEGIEIGRQHVTTLMKRMGIEAIYRRPNTSKPEPGHKIYPYLLRKLPVMQPNQVWAMDITPAFAGAGYTSRWRAGSSTSQLSSTGSAAEYSAIGYRSRWRPASALKRWRRLWLITAGPKSSTLIKAASSPAWPSPAR
jgi:putative transposase